MIDLVCLVVLGIAAWIGARAGVVSTLVSLGGLVGAYGAAFLLLRPGGELVGSLSGLQPMMALPIAGIAILLTATIGTTIIRSLIKRRRDRRMEDGWTPPAGDQIGGAVLNAAWAFGVVLLLVWVMGWVQSAHPGFPDARGSFVGRIAESLVGRAALTVTRATTGDDATARTAAHIARNPVEGTRSFVSVLNDRRVQSLLQNPDTRRALASGDGDAVGALAQDPELLRKAHQAGLLSKAPEDLSPSEARQDLADGLGPFVRTAEKLSADPEVQRLLSDRELRQRLETGDFAQLAGDPKFNELTRQVLELLRGNGSASDESP